MRNISIWSPALTGGGAEKISKYLINILISSGFTVSVYTYEQHPIVFVRKLVYFQMPSLHLTACLFYAIRYIFQSNSRVHFLNLNYINLAILLRVLSPRARIIVRCANTLSVELAMLSPFRRFLTYLAYWINFFVADFIVVQCKYMRNDLIQLYPLISSKIIVIYNPSVPSRGILTTFKLPLDALPESPYILTAASWKPQKDFNTLLKAYSYYTKTYKNPLPLFIAGVDKDNQFFHELMQKYNCLSNLVIPLGYIDNLDLYINRAAFCVLSSHYEGFSNFLVECISHLKLIAVSDCPGGNRELAKMYTGISFFQLKNWLDLSSLLCDLSSSHNASSPLPALKSNEIEESFVRKAYLDLFSSQFSFFK